MMKSEGLMELHSMFGMENYSWNANAPWHHHTKNEKSDNKSHSENYASSAYKTLRLYSRENLHQRQQMK